MFGDLRQRRQQPQRQRTDPNDPRRNLDSLKKETMLICQGVTYTHPNCDPLFSDIDLALGKHDSTALFGNNGVGKSTLLTPRKAPPALLVVSHDEYFLKEIGMTHSIRLNPEP